MAEAHTLFSIEYARIILDSHPSILAQAHERRSREREGKANMEGQYQYEGVGTNPIREQSTKSGQRTTEVCHSGH